MFKKLKKWWKERKERKESEDKAFLRAISANLNKKVEEMDSEYGVTEAEKKAIASKEGEIITEEQIKELNNKFFSDLCDPLGSLSLFDDTDYYNSKIPLQILTRCNLIAKEFGFKDLYFEDPDPVLFEINNELKDVISYRNKDGIFKSSFDKFSDMGTGEREAILRASVSIPVYPFGPDNGKWFVASLRVTVRSHYFVTGLENDDRIQEILIMVASALLERSTKSKVAERFGVTFIPDIIPQTFNGNAGIYVTKEKMIYDKIVFTNEDIEVSNMINHESKNGILKSVRIQC